MLSSWKAAKAGQPAQADEITVNSDFDIIHDILKMLSIGPTAATQYSDGVFSVQLNHLVSPV